MTEKTTGSFFRDLPEHDVTAHEGEGHYYAATFEIWVTGPDIYSVLTRLREHHQHVTRPEALGCLHYHLYYVPLPEASTYEIQLYVPRIPAATRLSRGENRLFPELPEFKLGPLVAPCLVEAPRS